MLYPFFLVLSSTLVIPTSITTEPCLIMSDLRKLGIPKATIIISAFFVKLCISGVRLCTKVTVEFPGLDLLLIKILIGLPTILLLPMTTVFLPSVSISYLSISSIIPCGVAGIKESIF